jgi:hypothetical protein
MLRKYLDGGGMPSQHVRPRLKLRSGCFKSGYSGGKFKIARKPNAGADSLSPVGVGTVSKRLRTVGTTRSSKVQGSTTALPTLGKDKASQHFAARKYPAMPPPPRRRSTCLYLIQHRRQRCWA